VSTYNGTFSITDVEKLMQEKVGKITAEKWANCVRHVVENEEERF
jgi:hypothetical protein